APAQDIGDQFRELYKEETIRFDTVDERKQDIGEAFMNMNNFLNLIGFVALLLGCIGVASAVHIYIKDKLPTVAILRTLGTSGKQAFFIYLLQIVAMGLAGSMLGAALGSLLQMALPVIFGEFLPIENVSTDISWLSMVKGILTGMGIAVLFALLPLLNIRRASPLLTLRVSFEENEQRADPLRWLVYLLIAVFIAGFT